MEPVVVRVTLSLIGPGLFILFGIAFTGTWMVERRRTHLLTMALACGLVATGAIIQIIYWPRDTGLNTMISGTFYTAGVLALVQGVLVQSGRGLGLWFHALTLLAIMAALGYFFYVDRNLLARVYTQNLGYGLLLVIAACRLAHLQRGALVDKILFWTLLVFGLHFFPRTFLTIGFSAPVGAAAFGDSIFWQTLQLSLAVLGAATAMAIFAATISDLMDDLRRERDLDHLTGILNRRGFEAAAKIAWKQPGVEMASLILCDVDHFKSINDTFGHPVGDEVLQRIAAALKKASRRRDIVGRVGGEEFAIFLPQTDSATAFECSERLRLAVLDIDFGHLVAGRFISASFGFATQEARRWERLYRTADAHLYEAKRNGRNQTWPDIASSEVEAVDTMSLPLIDRPSAFSFTHSDEHQRSSR